MQVLHASSLGGAPHLANRCWRHLDCGVAHVPVEAPSDLFYTEWSATSEGHGTRKLRAGSGSPPCRSYAS